MGVTRRRGTGIKSVGGRPRHGQHCSAALHCRRVWSIAVRSKRRRLPEQSRTFSMSKKQYRIAVIPGDGIGKEVMPEGLRVLEVAAKRFDIALDLVNIDWASCDHYAQHGTMMPSDWKAQLSGCDAILFGAVGWPDTVPDHVSLWGSLLLFRREFDQYVNLRPCRLMPGVRSPLVDRQGKARAPGE